MFVFNPCPGAGAGGLSPVGYREIYVLVHHCAVKKPKVKRRKGGMLYSENMTNRNIGPNDRDDPFSLICIY